MSIGSSFFIAAIFIVFLITQVVLIISLVGVIILLKQKSALIEKLKKEKNRLISKIKTCGFIFDDLQNSSNNNSTITMSVDLFKEENCLEKFEELANCVNEITETVNELRELFFESLDERLIEKKNSRIVLPPEVRQFFRDIIAELYKLSESEFVYKDKT